MVVDDTVTVSVQVNGKLRGTLSVAKTATKESVLAMAKELDGVKRHLEGVAIKKEIFVPGKIVNFVV